MFFLFFFSLSLWALCSFSILGFQPIKTLWDPPRAPHLAPYWKPASPPPSGVSHRYHLAATRLFSTPYFSLANSFSSSSTSSTSLHRSYDTVASSQDWVDAPGPAVTRSWRARGVPVTSL